METETIGKLIIGAVTLFLGVQYRDKIAALLKLLLNIVPTPAPAPSPDVPVVPPPVPAIVPNHDHVVDCLVETAAYCRSRGDDALAAEIAAYIPKILMLGEKK